MILILCAFLGQAQDDEAKAKLQEFKKTVQKSGVKEEEIDEAMQKLAETKHPLILKELLAWAKKPYKPVRKNVGGGGFEESGIKLNRTATSCVAERYEGEADAAKGLIDAFKARDAERPKKGSIEEEDLVGDLEHLVRSFGDVRCRKWAKELIAVFRHRYAFVSQAAFEAAATLKSKDLVEPLIQVLADAERMKDQDVQPDPKDPMGGNFGVEESRKDLYTSGAQRALEETTGAKQKDSQGWRKWWEANKGTFKEPD